MSGREGNNPKRRIAPQGRLTEDERKKLASRLVYVGSALHKRHPGDYGFRPPVNPRPSKSLCDGIRSILKADAVLLFKAGILKGLFSDFAAGEMPKYVWSVDRENEVFEAKIGQGGYHGYCLAEEDDMRHIVLKEWQQR